MINGVPIKKEIIPTQNTIDNQVIQNHQDSIPRTKSIWTEPINNSKAIESREISTETQQKEEGIINYICFKSETKIYRFPDAASQSNELLTILEKKNIKVDELSDHLQARLKQIKIGTNPFSVHEINNLESELNLLIDKKNYEFITKENTFQKLEIKKEDLQNEEKISDLIQKLKECNYFPHFKGNTENELYIYNREHDESFKFEINALSINYGKKEFRDNDLFTLNQCLRLIFTDTSHNAKEEIPPPPPPPPLLEFKPITIKKEIPSEKKLGISEQQKKQGFKMDLNTLQSVQLKKTSRPTLAQSAPSENLIPEPEKRNLKKHINEQLLKELKETTSLEGKGLKDSKQRVLKEKPEESNEFEAFKQKIQEFGEKQMPPTEEDSSSFEDN